MKIKALKGLVIRDSSSGKLTPIAQGAIADVDSTEGNALITEGLAVTGTKSITENGTGIDVTDFAEVDVNVGGGGGGDFSTAQVTATNNTEDGIRLSMPAVYELSTPRIEARVYLDAGDTQTFTVALYKGRTECRVAESGVASTGTGGVSGTGALFVVTGDGTVTFTGKM